MLFDDDLRSTEIAADSLASQLPLQDAQLLWVDACGPALPGDLARLLGADPALLTTPDSAAGVLVIDDWKYLYVQALDRCEDGPTNAVPLAFAVGPNVVITLHADDAGFLSSVLDNEADYLRVGKLDSMTFAASLLDRMLTDYLDERDDFETILDDLELSILRRPDPGVLEALQRMRRTASKLRQLLTDQRDLFDAIGRPDFDPHLSQRAGHNCRLLRTRYTQVTTSMETARELVNGSFELYTSRVAENTNATMHTLTFITVMIGLLATIAGVMGMNFDAPVYGTGQRGFLLTIAAMLGIALVALGWLVHRRRHAASPPKRRA
jgi:Mg2+ and Co2+ transporter CorA